MKEKEKKALLPFTKPFVICALLAFASIAIYLLIDIIHPEDPLYLSELRGIPVMVLFPISAILFICWFISLFRRNENMAKLKSFCMVAVCIALLIFAVAVFQTGSNVSMGTMHAQTEQVDGQDYLIYEMYNEKIRLSPAQYEAIENQGESESCSVSFIRIPLLRYSRITYFEDSKGNVIK